MRCLLPLVALLLLVACAPSAAPTVTPTVAPPAPTATPTINLAPTQTRAAELSQIATLTAPTATSTAPPTSTPEPPTSTPVPPTATPVSPTAIPTAAVTGEHRRWLDTNRRVFIGSGSEDVTGDGTPDYLYRSGNEGCVSCHAQYITVFWGQRLIFDGGPYTDPVVSFVPDRGGFVVTESVVGPTESYGGATGRIVHTYRFSNGTFTLVSQQFNVPAYRFSNAAAIKLMHGGIDETVYPCTITGDCAPAIQRGLPKLQEGAARVRALIPPPVCATLHAASLRFVAADEAFFAKLQAQGPRYDTGSVLINTQREVQVVLAARDAWSAEQQYGACR